MILINFEVGVFPDPNHSDFDARMSVYPIKRHEIYRPDTTGVPLTQYVKQHPFSTHMEEFRWYYREFKAGRIRPLSVEWIDD